MLYAAPYRRSTPADKEDTWYRVQALHFDTKSVRVLYLDYGCQGDVPLRVLHSLEGQFLTLPFQASVHSLILGDLGFYTTADLAGWPC